MEQIQTEKTNFSEADVTRVFEELDLKTQEQRDAVLEQKSIGESSEPKKIRYITRLSNSTVPAPLG